MSNASVSPAVGWVLSGVTAVGFLFPFGAVPKLLGDPFSRDLFTKVAGEGMARTAMLGTGVMELVVAVLVLVPATRVYGAVLAALMMLGAIGSHLFTPLGILPELTDQATGETATAPVFFFAIVLLGLAAVQVYLYRGQLPIGGAVVAAPAASD